MTSLTVFDEDESHTPVAPRNPAAINLSKSASNLPPASNQSRVSRIKTAIAAKDDDLERAQDSKFGH